MHDDSLRPALVPGDRILADPRWAPGLDRGALVVLQDPEAPTRRLVKRVAALPGETVAWDRNRYRLIEPTEADRAPGGPTAERVARLRAEIFVVGDRRDLSRDSRAFGPVPLASVLGVVWYRTGPADRRGEIPPAAAQSRTPSVVSE
ncbi:MAG: signal peptidase I [Thermoplasmata archaeon]